MVRNVSTFEISQKLTKAIELLDHFTLPNLLGVQDRDN
jgi:hypothetical protein